MYNYKVLSGIFVKMTYSHIFCGKLWILCVKLWTFWDFFFLRKQKSSIDKGVWNAKTFKLYLKTAQNAYTVEL